MEKVSIVVPVYNTSLEQFRMCVESIRKQTYTNYEVILVDDGSGNGVENLCDEYVQRDRRFHVLHQPNCGLSGARNRGTDLADGKWLIYLDPDDWWEPDTLELLCEKMERDMLDVLFFSYFDCYENKGQVERRCWKKPGQEYTFLTDKQKRNLQMGMLDESVAEGKNQVRNIHSSQTNKKEICRWECWMKVWQNCRGALDQPVCRW